MNAKEYQQMEKFEKTYWWHRGRLYLIDKLVKKYLPKQNEKRNFLEIGCGTGATLKLLSKYGDISGIDISKKAVAHCKAKGFKDITLGDINELDLRSLKNKFDAVFSLDVLEHVQDDVKMMTRVNKMLKNDGLFIITVPAHKFLWSEHDEALHHKRRYHSLEIVQKLEDAGLEVIKKSYFVFFAFAPIMFFRTWNSIFGRSVYPKTSYVILPEILNNLAINFLKLETKMLQAKGLPIGTTLVVIARKPTSDD
jgi:2-polyprenyl-3-methyl-5-hydroxy-6-metoxy-1,4-benzoquinol methylase